jgi:hypothetical protein
MMPRLRTLVLGLLSVATAAQAQSAPDSAPRFSRVTSVRELSDGRVLVSDAGQMKVFVLPRDLRSADQVGRLGEGVGAYRSADLLAEWGDTTLVFDIYGEGFVHIDPSLAIGRTQPIRKFGSTPNPIVPEVRGLDRSGMIYFTGQRANRGSNATRDSVPLLRRAIDAERADTLTWIRIPVSGLRRAKGADSLIRSNPDPFEWRDVFAIDRSGRVAVVRGDDYRVEFIEDGRVVRGAGNPGTRIEVTEADIQRLRERRFSIMTPQGPQTMTAEPAHAVTPVKPIVDASEPPLVDTRGRLWVERSRAANDSLARYEVFNPTGTTAFSVALKDNARVVGFGENSLYATKPAGNRRILSKATLPR